MTKTILATGVTNYSLNNTIDFITRLFGNDVNIIIIPEGNILKIKIYKDNNNKLKPKPPPNIKHNSTLSYYCSKYNLCLIPLNNGMWIIKNSCGKNKAIRPLFKKDES